MKGVADDQYIGSLQEAHMRDTEAAANSSITYSILNPVLNKDIIYDMLHPQIV